jgi:anaerobic selenocysteine-containing dehydrogenase
VKPPADDLPARRDEFPLITYGSPFFRSADSVKNPWLLEIMPTNRALINPADAEELGIAQGDTVTIETRDGVKSAPLKAHVLPGIKPGVLALARGYGNRQFGAGLQVIAGARVPGDPTRAAGVNASGLTAFSASQIVRIYKS